MKHTPGSRMQAPARIIALALAATLAPATFAQHAGHGPAGTPPPSKAAATHAGHGGMDMKSMMKDMNDKMAGMPMSGDPDIDFAMMMRIHHIGAIDMAEAQLRDGKNPQMIRMAKDIIAAQNKEIAIFDKFLAGKGHARPKAVPGVPGK